MTQTRQQSLRLPMPMTTENGRGVVDGADKLADALTDCVAYLWGRMERTPRAQGVEHHD